MITDESTATAPPAIRSADEFDQNVRRLQAGQSRSILTFQIVTGIGFAIMIINTAAHIDSFTLSAVGFFLIFIYVFLLGTFLRPPVDRQAVDSLNAVLAKVHYSYTYDRVLATVVSVTVAAALNAFLGFPVWAQLVIAAASLYAPQLVRSIQLRTLQRKKQQLFPSSNNIQT